MIGTANTRESNFGWVRPLGWGAAGMLLLAPLIAMNVAPDSGVNWTAGDFLFASLMFGTVGLLVELAVRASSDWSYRIAAMIAVGTGFLLVWANLAVGYIGDGSSAINLAFLAIPPVALLFSVLVRFRAPQMAWVMGAAAAAHAITGAIGYPLDTRTGPITIVFTLLWLGAALLFRKSAGRA
ncbi:MAG TPA: hypothetical protein VF637_03495 [Sphingomicrobium sp.]|jgi:hypothetical protein